MNVQQPPLMQINAPSLPKGGGAIQSIGKGWGGVGTSGAASLTLPLPISLGRGFAPALSLGYSSDVGNSPFGIGWRMTADAITLRLVPRVAQVLPRRGPAAVVCVGVCRNTHAHQPCQRQPACRKPAPTPSRQIVHHGMLLFEVAEQLWEGAAQMPRPGHHHIRDTNLSLCRDSPAGQSGLDTCPSPCATECSPRAQRPSEENRIANCKYRPRQLGAVLGGPGRPRPTRPLARSATPMAQP